MEEVDLKNIEFYEETEFKETEIGPLPKNWEVVRLGEVAEINNGGPAPQEEKYFGGSNYFIRVQHIDNERNIIKTWDLITDEAVKQYKLKLFKKNTIVFPKTGATIYLEKRAKLPFDAYIVSHLCAVNSIINNLNQDYLFYVLVNTKFSEKKGDGYPTLNISEIKQIIIPIPPLTEQQKIAAVLSAIQEAKEKTERVIEATKNLKKSLMKHLFTYGPVPLSDIDKVELKETEIGPLPTHWQVVRLGEVAKIIMGQSPPGNTYNKEGIGYPFLQGKAEFGDINPKNIKFTTNPLKISPKDSVLISVRAPVGDVNIANMNYCIGRGLASLSLVGGNNIFLFYCLLYLKPYIEKEGTGSTFKEINKSKLENLLIPLPPISEQQKIAEILSSVDEKIQKEEERKKALENLFKSMLHNLMTGKIRVRSLNLKG
jgi:type I restriction enzyme S subunit